MGAAGTTLIRGNSNPRWLSEHKKTISSHPHQPKQSWGLKEALRAKACSYCWDMPWP